MSEISITNFFPLLEGMFLCVSLDKMVGFFRGSQANLGLKYFFPLSLSLSLSLCLCVCFVLKPLMAFTNYNNTSKIGELKLYTFHKLGARNRGQHCFIL